MKNKIVILLTAFTAVLFTFSFSPAKKKSPCGPYTITNNAFCDVNVNYSYGCSGGGLCASGSNVVIPVGGGVINIPACTGCASGNCKITVSLIQVGGTVLGTPVMVTQANPNGTFNPALCGAGTAGTIVWTATGTTIN